MSLKGLLKSSYSHIREIDFDQPIEQYVERVGQYVINHGLPDLDVGLAGLHSLARRFEAVGNKIDELRGVDGVTTSHDNIVDAVNAISFTLGAAVENLPLASIANIDGIGNLLTNVVTGIVTGEVG